MELKRQLPNLQPVLLKKHLEMKYRLIKSFNYFGCNGEGKLHEIKPIASLRTGVIFARKIGAPFGTEVALSTL